MKEIYDWVPWFTELSRKIAAGDPKELVDRARQVTWSDKEKDPPTMIRSVGPDPFTFIYYIAARSTTFAARRIIYPSISKIFDIEMFEDKDSEHTCIFPTPMPLIARFNMNDSRNLPLLWDLFCSAVKGIESIRDQDFDRVLQIPGNKIPKLTQALFLINPNEFVPLDKRMISLQFVPSNQAPQWANCRDSLTSIRAAFPSCMPYEINMISYLLDSNRLRVRSSRCFQVSSNVMDDGEDCWKDFNSNNWVYTGGPKSGISWDEYDQSDVNRGYPLQAPTLGDVVLVRTGRRRGRGIGVVHNNDYRDLGLNANSKLHVLWLNKKSARLSGDTPIMGFSRAGDGTAQAFRGAEAYAPTFDLLDRLDWGEPAVSKGKNASVRDADPPAQVNVSSIEHPRNQILYGPPGTGKTWSTVRHALAIIDGVEVQGAEDDRERFRKLRFNLATRSGQIAMVTFHQNFAYEDFVEGIRPVLADDIPEGSAGLRYERRDGIFKQIARAAESNAERRFVLIIDEINRGNIAKIFGELITLIEDSRRIGRDDETYVTLPYSGDAFGVPDNLYVIGTMNTADRSIQLLDTALRRRFEFVEMMPDTDHELIPEDVDGVKCRKMLRAMNECIAALLDREHQIGHTYLFDVNGMEDLARAFQNKVFPLLQEYFFDDWPKIRAVLGGNGFVQEQNPPKSLQDSDLLDPESRNYDRLPKDDSRWRDSNEYRKIYESPKPDTAE